jgi:hypothetical protein
MQLIQGSDSNKRGMPGRRGAVRFSQLSGPRQLLVRLCQATNYGHIQGLEVKDSEPKFNHETLVWLEIKLDVDDGARPELHLADFPLLDEIRRLMARMDEIQNGVIAKIEIRGGIPRRLVYSTLASEVLR